MGEEGAFLKKGTLFPHALISLQKLGKEKGIIRQSTRRTWDFCGVR